MQIVQKANIFCIFLHKAVNLLLCYGYVYIICFIHPCTHFYFSLPTEKFLRGQGEKYTQAEKENYKSICRKWECHRKGHVLTFIVGKYRLKKGVSWLMTHPLTVLYSYRFFIQQEIKYVHKYDAVIVLVFIDVSFGDL